MDIRSANESDLRAITDIYAHHVRNGTGSFEEDPPSLQEISARWRALVDGRYPYLVAVKPSVDSSGHSSDHSSGLASPPPSVQPSPHPSVHFSGSADSQVVGFAYAGVHKPRSAYRFTVEDSVYVAPGYENKGIGRALLTKLITESRQRGFRQMMAVIGDSKNTGSIRLHQNLGFELIGTARNLGFKYGRWLDIVYMQRNLQDD